MEFIREEKRLKIVIDDEDRKSLKEVAENNHNDLGTTKAEVDFFEDYLANSEFGWLLADEIGALTDAPLLGVTDENDKVIEAYGYMDYQVSSMLEELDCYGYVHLTKG